MRLAKRAEIKPDYVHVQNAHIMFNDLNVVIRKLTVPNPALEIESTNGVFAPKDYWQSISQGLGRACSPSDTLN
ncbi:hypothetical protein ASG68_29225 [Rhizobium sp. Leaf453]|nr:hypothetical protein ASG42_29875 [Rhizobium sp. Leaf391]KQT04691.1 hypothetical protein ASG50_15595 [Rhizobium sp. Leaf386]KQU00967.1 hypothetical protein ASG68_29225 [Rhizobium sp. Leaf453]